jgi:hypothetical protein
MTAPAALTYGYSQFVNAIALNAFGLSPTSVDVITDGVLAPTDPRVADILRAIQDGLLFVYNAHRWSFLRPVVLIQTLPPYNTGTITVTSGGVVTLTGGTFPVYSASANGQLWIGTPSPPVFYSGIWQIGTYGGPTSLTLTSYNGPQFTMGIPYLIVFNQYPTPTGFDTFEEELSEPGHGVWHRHTLQKVDEIEIRREMQHFNGQTHRPRMYSISTKLFDPTAGSARYVNFWPVPGMVHNFYGKAILRPTMLDVTNSQPIGIEILAPVFMESILAAAERNIDQQDASHPDAVHNRTLGPLLAMAIQRDRENAAADFLGVDHGRDGYEWHRRPYRDTSIYWQNSVAAGGYTGWL